MERYDEARTANKNQEVSTGTWEKEVQPIDLASEPTDKGVKELQ